MEINKIYNGDCLEMLKSFEDNSIDSVVTDPPYGIKFMNKKWDYDIPSVEVWQEVLRVLKPGGHILVACGTRTQHKMATNIELAGFEIRDVISWIYGSGFPKSLNIGKKIDEILGSEREIIINNLAKPTPFSEKLTQRKYATHKVGEPLTFSEPISNEAKEFEGWGTALKPACEFFTLARKPISEKSIAENVLKWKTGGMNIDECRIETNKKKEHRKKWLEPSGQVTNYKSQAVTSYGMGNNRTTTLSEFAHKGRFPSNLILDEEAGKMLDEQSGESFSSGGDGSKFIYEHCNVKMGPKHRIINTNKNGLGLGDYGGASRFFYCPKVSPQERDEGLEGFEEKCIIRSNQAIAEAKKGNDNIKESLKTEGGMAALSISSPVRNFHPTIKPIELMRYLTRLITPKNGLCLDPFIGSGTTAIACVKEGFRYIGIEREDEYVKIAEARIKHTKKNIKIIQKRNGTTEILENENKQKNINKEQNLFA